MVLSPPQRPLCVVGRLGRKEKRERGTRWEGEREKGGLFRLFPLPIVPRALSIFSIIAIFVGIRSGSLCGEERAQLESSGLKTNISTTQLLLRAVNEFFH